jgi:non-specific serine/threonine protein kinase
LRESGESASVRLSRLDAAPLNHLRQGPPLSWQGGGQLRDFAQRLQQLDSATLQTPPGLRAD